MQKPSAGHGPEVPEEVFRRLVRILLRLVRGENGAGRGPSAPRGTVS